MIDRKYLVIGAIATAVITAGVGAYYLFRDKPTKDNAQACNAWADVVNHTLEALVHAHNEAVAEFPSDHSKASFSFEIKANNIITGLAVHKEDLRYEALMELVNSKKQDHIQAIRKG